MSVPDHRLSTSVIDAAYIAPEDEIKPSFIEDREGGPIAIGDPTGGMNYQSWVATYEAGDIILTPETVGTPTTMLTIPNVAAISFCFDQNARPTVAYQTNVSVYLYWYDTDAQTFVTTPYPNAVGFALSLDDKRDRETGSNDIIFWYTEEQSANPPVYYLYTREQRDRFEIPYRMDVNGQPFEVPPYIWKAGMHKGLRGKVQLTYRVP